MLHRGDGGSGLRTAALPNPCRKALLHTDSTRLLWRFRDLFQRHMGAPEEASMGVSSPTRGGELHLCGYGEALILLGRGLVREDHSYPVGNPSLLFCKEVQ